MLEPAAFEIHWKDIARELDKHPEIWRGHYTKEWLYDEVMAERMQAWAFCEDAKIKIVVFTRMIVYPPRKALQVPLVIGNTMKRLYPQIEEVLENFALHEGCEICEIGGREGWLRLLGRRYNKHYVVTLAPERHMH